MRNLFQIRFYSGGTWKMQKSALPLIAGISRPRFLAAHKYFESKWCLRLNVFAFDRCSSPKVNSKKFKMPGKRQNSQRNNLCENNHV